MSKLICHAGRRVAIVRNAKGDAIVRHREDGSKCLSRLVFQGKNTYTPEQIVKEERP